MAAQPSAETKPIIYVVRQSFTDPDTVQATILGERFGATQGSGSVKIEPNSFIEDPSVVSWSDTKVVVDVDFVPDSIRNSLEQGVIKVYTDDGQSAGQGTKQADLYGKKSNPPYALDDSKLVDDILTLNGTNMDKIEAVILEEDVTGDELVAVELDKMPAKYCVKLPETANGIKKATIIARNATSTESFLAEDIDQDTTGPGFVWQAAAQVTDVTAGKGLTVSNVPSGLTTAKVTGQAAEVVFKTIAPYNANNTNNLTLEAYYTNPAETEVLIRWDETVLFEPVVSTEPWQSVELLDYINAPILLTPQGGDVWEFAPSIASITEDASNYYFNGTQLGGVWAIVIYDTGGTNNLAIHSGYAYGQNGVITEFTDTQVKVPKTFLTVNWSQSLPVTVDRITASAIGGAGLIDETGSWTINP